MNKVYTALIPIIWGIFIAFLFENNINKFEKYFSRFISCLVVYGLVVLFLTIAIFIILPVLYNEVEVIGSYIPQILEYILSFIDEGKVSSVNDGIKTIVGISADFAIKKIISFSSFISILVSSFIAAAFISIDKNSLLKTIDNHFVMPIHIKNFINSCSNILNHYLLGMTYDLLFLFVSLYILFYFFRINNSLFYAFFLSFMNMIPYFGPTIGFIVIVITFYISKIDNYILCLLLVWIIQQLEGNFIQPFIFKKTLYIRPILTFATLLIMGKFLGVIGMIIAPVLAAIIQIAYRTFVLTKENNELAKWEDI